MHLSILQLNINGLRWKENLFHFLNTHEYDILQFQEVAGENTHVGALNSVEDNYEVLTNFLGNEYKGFLIKSDIVSPQGYFGNATFVKSSLPVKEHKSVWLHKRTDPFSSTDPYDQMSRTIMCVLLNTPTPLWLLNTHLTWGTDSKDTPNKLNQSLPIVEFIASLQSPYILTGDFNVDSSSLIVKGLEHYGRNLIKEHHATNTLNPNTHRAGHLFPPGLAVDFIFPSFSLKVTKFRVIDEVDLSDHLGLEVEIEV